MGQAIINKSWLEILAICHHKTSRGHGKDKPNSARDTNTTAVVAEITVVVTVMAVGAAFIFAASRFEAGALLIHGNSEGHGSRQDDKGEDLGESHGGDCCRKVEADVEKRKLVEGVIFLVGRQWAFSPLYTFMPTTYTLRYMDHKRR